MKKKLRSVGTAIRVCLCFSLLMCLALSCQSEYTKMVNEELESGVSHDTLLFNLKFGDTKKEFFEKCWELNKQGLATHGPTNNYVQTFLYPKDSTNTIDKLSLLFYSKFNENNVTIGMDMKFSYVGWSLWNDDLQADKLVPVVKDTLMKWYPGNKFIQLKNKSEVKVDGNRQIRIFQESKKDVAVIIENLAYKYEKLVENK